MKLTVEIDTDAVMESVGKAVERGAIAHWGSGTYHPRSGKASPYVAIVERVQGRPKGIDYRLGERALADGLRRVNLRVVASIADAPSDATVDVLVQTALLGEVLYQHETRGEA